MLQGFSVFRRKGRPHWFVKYPDDSARDGWRSEATAFRVDDPNGKRKATAAAARKAQEYRATGNRSAAGPWGEWVEAYLEDKYQNSPVTLTAYRGAWRNLHPYLLEQSVRVPGTLNYQHVLGYVQWRSAQQRHSGALISRNTALLEVRVLGILMREAVRRGFAQGNPCERTGIRRDPAKEKREFTAAEIQTVREALELREGHLAITRRWMTVCWEIALHQGCRLTETQVPMELVDEARGTIQFAGKGRHGVKRVFTTTLHDDLKPLMQRLRAAGASVTCTLPRMAAKEWHFLFKGLKMRGVSFHSTRVTVITRLARAGVPEQQAMRYVNHSSTAVHRIYQKLRADDLGGVTRALKF
ncbi:MAG: hypothetical protein RJA36_3838 [Pseudomonadota bacterium]|jgi:integrase